MPKYDLRVLLETVEGKKTSYFTSGSSYGHFVDTDTRPDDLVLSSSQVFNRITASVSCSFINDVNFSGVLDTNTIFKSNSLLSASLIDGVNTGSVDFIASTSEYDRLLRYKFIGDKVCTVLGLPSNQWVYVDQIRFPVDDESNIFQGNIDVGNAFVSDTLTFANNANINSDVPFYIDTGSDRYIKFIDTRGTGQVSLIFGYDKDSDTYEINASTGSIFNIKNLNTLQVDTINAAQVNQVTSSTQTTLATSLTGVTSISGSLIVSGSEADEPIVKVFGNIRSTGDLIAERYVVSSSVTHLTQSFSSGSTIFGDTPLDDTHQFTGSVFISGSTGLDVIGNITASGNISSSGTGTFNKLEVHNGSPKLVLKDLTDDDDHQIQFQDNGGNVDYKITTANDVFNIHAVVNRPIAFHTNDTERIRILNGGNVGIGVTDPDRPLEVVSGDDNVAKFYSTDDLAIVEVRDDNTVGHLVAKDNVFGIGGSGSLSAHNLNIMTTTGRVGIGVTSPSAKLDVVGTTGRAAEFSSANDAPILVESTDGTTGITFKDNSAEQQIYYRGNRDSFYIETPTKLGLGTNDPSETLDVRGSASFSGHITASGNISSSGTITANALSVGGGIGGVGLSVTNITASGNISASGTQHFLGGTVNIMANADNQDLFKIQDVDNENNLSFRIDSNQHGDFHLDRNSVDKIRINTYWPAQIDNDSYETFGGLILGSDADRGDKTGFGLYVSAGPDSGSIYTKERVFIGVGGATGSNDMLSVGGNITATSHITASGNISSSGTGSFTGGGVFGDRVGIGTTTPNADLHINNSSGEPTILLTGQGDNPADAARIRLSEQSDGNNYIELKYDGSANRLSFDSNNQNDMLSIDRTNNRVFTGDSTNFKVGSHITASGNISSSGVISASRIHGELGATFNGDVDVVGNVTATTFTTQVITQNLSAGSTVFGDTNDDLHFFSGSLVVQHTGSNNVGLRLTNSNLHIDGGKIGIGTSNPEASLDIIGNLRTSSHITASGNISGSSTSTLTMGGDITANDLIVNQITASGDISSSGEILTKILASPHVNELVFKTNNIERGRFKSNGTFKVTKDIQALSHITASGNISGSSTSSLSVGGQATLGGINSTSHITASGNISGSATSTGSFGKIEIPDSGRITIGDAVDFKIFHDGSGNSVIREDGGGDLFLQGNKIRIRENSDGGTIALFTDGAGTELRHDNVKKFETSDSGINVSGAITSSGDISASGDIRTKRIRFPSPTSTEGHGIIFKDTSSNAPNTNVNSIQWDFSNDDAFIYANQSSSDGTYLVNELRDNTVTDKFVWWFNNYVGRTTDSFPLMLEGNKAVINYYYDRRTTFHRDNNATNGAANNVDFYLLKSGSTSVSTANSLIHGDVSVGKTTLNDIVFVDGNLTASGDISSSGKIFGGDDLLITDGTRTIQLDINNGSNEPEIKATGATLQINKSNGVDTSFDGNTLYIDASENSVGIGDSSPNAKLQVNGNIYSLSHITASGNISSSHTGSFGKLTVGAPPTMLSANTQLTVAGGEGGVDIASFYRNLGGTGRVNISFSDSDPTIEFFEDVNDKANSIGSDATNSNLVFATGSRLKEKEAMVIQNDGGNVGIGINSPGQKLTVEGNISASGELFATDLTLNGSGINIVNDSGFEILGTGTQIMNIGSQGDLVLLAGSGRTNTADDLHFGSAGVNSQMVLKDGKLGIGTTSPTETLEISGSGMKIHNGNQDGPLKFFRHSSETGRISSANSRLSIRARNNKNISIEDTNDNIGFFLKHGGNVGIGTTDPSKELDVVGDIRASGDIIAQRYIVSSSVSHLTQSFSSGSTIFGDTPADDTHRFTGSLDISGSGTDLTVNGKVGIGITSPTVNLEILETGNNNAQLDINTNAEKDAILGFSSDEDTDGNPQARIGMDYSQNQLKLVATSSFSSHNHLVISQSGNIGIGTATPTSKLQVSGDVTTTHITASGNISASGALMGNDLILHNDGGVSAEIQSTTGDSFIRFTDGGSHKFSIGFDNGDNTFAISTGSGLSGNQSVTVKGDGNVGIGTTNPKAPLHVIGNISASADIDLYGNPSTINFVTNDESNAYIKGSTGALDLVHSQGNYEAGIRLDTQGNIKFATDHNSGLDFSNTHMIVSHSISNGDAFVGIGTIHPTAKLHISTGDAQLKITDTTGANHSASIFLQENDNFGAKLKYRSASDVFFGISTVDGGTETDRLNIDRNGKVGIGVAVPSETLDIGGNVKTSGNVSSPSFQSGFAGNGFRITSGSDGKQSFTIDDLTVRGQMNVFEMLIHQVRATNGSLFVSNTGRVVSASLENASKKQYKLFFDTGSGYGHSFRPGDVIRAQRFTPDVNGSGSADGPASFKSDLTIESVTGISESIARLTGSNGTTDAPTEGYEYVKIGNLSDSDRQGSIYLTADDDNAPFIDVIDKVTAHSDFNTSGKVKTRIGKLDGITTSARFGTLSGYGFYASGSAFLEGSINATSGSIGDFIIDNTEIRDTGLDLRLKSNGQITASKALIQGSSKIAGFEIDNISISDTGNNLILSSSGQITASNAKITGDITATSGNFLGDVNATHINTTSGSIGGFEITTSEIKDNNGNLRLKSSGQITASNVFFDGGKIGGFDIVGKDASAADAISSVSKTLILSGSGQLTASNANITGKITATSGQFSGDVIATHIRTTSGSIGGFDLGTNKISSSHLIISSSTGTSEIISASKFNVKADGQLTASNVLLDGGKIGGFEIDADEIKSTNLLLDSTNEKITVGSSNAIKIQGGGTDNFIVMGSKGSFSDEGSGTAGILIGMDGTNPQAEFVKDANNHLIFDNGLTLKTSGTAVLSGSNIEILSPNVFLGKGNSNFISASGGKLEISSSNFHLKDGNITASNVDLSGKITATSGQFSGDIIATHINTDSGSIGGFKIDNTSISSSNGALRLKSSGQISGSNVLFTGGEIGGFKITNTQISASDGGILLSGSGEAILANGGITFDKDGNVNITGSVTIGTNVEIKGDNGFNTIFFDDFSQYASITDLTSSGDSPKTDGSGQSYHLVTGDGEKSFVTNGDEIFGNRALQLGNDSGNDEVWLSSNRLIPFNSQSLYEVEIRIKKTEADNDGSEYFGITGYAADGTTKVNATGADSFGSQHYFGLSGTSTDLYNGYRIYKGYFKGYQGRIPGGAGGRHPNITDPGVVTSGSGNTGNKLMYFAPLILVNYDNKDGVATVDYIRISEFNDGNGTKISGDNIQTGKITSNNLSTTAGSEFNLQDGTFKLGGTSNPNLSFDGATLQVSGTISASVGNIGGFTIGDTTLTAGNVTIDSANEQIKLGSGAGATANSGVFLDSDGTFNLAVSATDYIRKNGTDLEIKSENTTLSGSNIEILSPSIFLGGSSNFISASTGQIEITSSNFHLKNGNITASNADISGKIVTSNITADGGTIANWDIDSSVIQKTGSSSTDGIVIDSSNKVIQVHGASGTGVTANSRANARLLLGKVSTAEFGIKGFNDGGTRIFELSDNRTEIAGFDFTNEQIAKNNITMSNANGGKITLNQGTTFLSGSGEGQFANGSIKFDKFGNLDITDARLRVSDNGFSPDAFNASTGKFVDMLEGDGNVKVVAFEDNTIVTRISQSGDIRDTFALSASQVTPNMSDRRVGDIYDANKPIFAYNTEGAPLAPLSAVGKTFLTMCDRDNPIKFHFFSPFGDAKVHIASGSDGSGVFDKTLADITVSQSLLTTQLGTNSPPDTHEFYQITSSLPIVVSARNTTTAGDRIYIPPVSKEVFMPSERNALTMEGTANQTISNVSKMYYFSDSPFALVRHGDGDGTDAEHGLPIEMLGDTYVVPHALADWRIISVETGTINVIQVNHGEETVVESYNISGSKSNPQEVATGSIAGSDANLFSAQAVRFEGTMPFFLRVNDPSGNDEYPVLGYRRDVSLPQYQNSTTIEGGRVRTGKIQSNNFTTTAGSEFDLDNATFTLGGSANPSLNFDGSNLKLSGSSTELLTPNIFLGTGTTNFISASGGKLEISSSNFHLKEGNITASNVDLSGKITAQTGTIGGFNIGTDLDSSAGTLKLKGATGQITASAVSMSGEINANAGSIGNWKIVGNKISGSNITLDADSSRIFKSDENDELTGYYLDFTPGTNFYVRFGTNFAVSSSGTLFASGAKIEGVLTSSTGKIGGWNIGPTTLSSTNVTIDSANEDITLGSKDSLTDSNTGVYIGTDGLAIGANSVFKVTSAGALNATNATLTGTVTANAGQVGGFNITSNSITSSNNKLILSSSGQITGSSVLFNGGKIGGFTIDSSVIKSTNEKLKFDSVNQKIDVGTNVVIKGTTSDGFIGMGDKVTGFVDEGVGTEGILIGMDGSNPQAEFVKDANNHFIFDDGLTIKTTGTTVLSGSNVEILTPKFFFGDKSTSFISSSTSQIEISSSAFHLQKNGQITGSKVLLEGGRVGGFTISASEISSSGLLLKSSGQITASAVSMSGTIVADSGNVGGFAISQTEISSSGLLLKSSGQITASAVSMSGTIVTSDITADGGKIGGFAISSNVLNNIEADASLLIQSGSIINDGFVTQLRVGKVQDSGSPLVPTFDEARFGMSFARATNTIGLRKKFFELSTVERTIAGFSFDEKTIFSGTTISMSSDAGGSINLNNGSIIMSGSGLLNISSSVESPAVIKLNSDGATKGIDLDSTQGIIGHGDVTNREFETHNGMFRFTEDTISTSDGNGATYDTAGENELLNLEHNNKAPDDPPGTP